MTEHDRVGQGHITRSGSGWLNQSAAQMGGGVNTNAWRQRGVHRIHHTRERAEIGWALVGIGQVHTVGLGDDRLAGMGDGPMAPSH
jgi:hypothetical protein